MVLCANKSDLRPDVDVAQIVEEEMMPIMQEFKEIDSCIRASVKERRNINEVCRSQASVRVKSDSSIRSFISANGQ